jgi:hypothetical protein
MILYLTSALEQLPLGKASECAMKVCALAGHSEDHLCFTTEPLQGLGKHVYSLDIPLALVEQYEYTNEFRLEKTRYFALPTSLLRRHVPERSAYEEITARPWNRWVAVVLDKRPDEKHPEMKGKWAIVWASRKEAVSAKVYRKVDGQYLSIEITASSDFDPMVDYIVLENHEEMARPGGVGGKETWKLLSVAGVTPQWAIFPTAWQNWVWDKKVTRSATEYIVQHVPTVRSDINYAMQKGSKENKARSWRLVAEEVGRSLSNKLGVMVDLGKLAGHSWTAVAAMPHRIANRMSQNLPYAPWTPPLPQPEYANPDESGRYVLANLHGPYPTHGPGVDHAPQERPYTGREGELAKPDNQDSFNLGQRAPALALA